VAEPLPSVSAVLPAYNEAGVIAGVVTRTASALIALDVPEPEIVVVDDGSRDGTAALAGEVACDGVRVRVITHPRNRGYGAALRTGFDAASGDAVLLMDSDGQFDPADLDRLLPQYRADRLVAGFRMRRSDPLIRVLNQRAFFMVVRLLFGRTARDVNCGFKLFPRAVGCGLSSDGALISTELLVRAREHGHAIVDVPVPHAPRLTGAPTGARPSVVLRAFVELWRLHRRMRAEPARLQADLEAAATD